MAKKWELRIRRLSEQTGAAGTRTVGSYQVLHDGQPVTHTVTVDGVQVALSGTTAESPGPSQNAAPASPSNPSRIVAKAYPLAISGGPQYMTHGYRQDTQIKKPMPGIELLDTGKRTAILVHPGKNAFLSSIGCINLCTDLPKAAEIINYAGSRRRVIALIEDMKAFLGPLPTADQAPIPGATITIDEQAVLAAQPEHSAAAGHTYTVQRDDTLGKIAEKFGTTWQVLKALNDLPNANQIVPGQSLKLPDSTVASHPDLGRPATSAGAEGPVTTQLPASGTGFVTYNPDDAHGSDRYGTAGFVAALIDLGKAWAANEAVPISFGDMCRKGGPRFPPHRGHCSGREVDIRPFRKDGRNRPVTWQSSEYDQAATRRLIELVKAREPHAHFFFNDPVLIGAHLCKRLGGHDNHLHLQIYD